MLITKTTLVIWLYNFLQWWAFWQSPVSIVCHLTRYQFLMWRQLVYYNVHNKHVNRLDFDISTTGNHGNKAQWYGSSHSPCCGIAYVLGDGSQRVLVEGRVCKNTLEVVHLTQSQNKTKHNINNDNYFFLEIYSELILTPASFSFLSFCLLRYPILCVNICV